ncbi:ABC transporter permease [Thermoactinospora rubra]|uniref:ABC transporter permease n=1 Tax=Thermoactinospora rubra TaxID=1088767 RepID=UPI000A10FA20|nr:ABC transporter permease [Thermoactinospora rubra]
MRGRLAGGARRLAGLWLVPVVIAVWEVTTRLLEDTDFPPPSTIVTSMYELWFSGPPSRLFFTDEAIGNILPSLGRMFAGWILAAVIGVLLGVALGRAPVATQYVDPLIQLGRAIPPPLLVSLFALLFREELRTQLATIVFGVIWPVLLNSIEGARSVDPVQVETATVFGLSRRQQLWRIVIPAAAPKIFAGLRLSLSLALILMVIAEVFAGSDGIGYQLREAQREFETPIVWGAIVLLGVLGYLVNSLFVLAESRLLVWHRQATRAT